MGFLNPALLGLLSLGMVPIIIHLLNRRRHLVVRWAAMAFLRHALEKTRQRLRLENLLLLLVRTLAVLLVCLAATRPFLASAAGAVGLHSSRSHLYLLLDNSASMGYAEGLGTLLARAVAEARAELDSSDLGADGPVTLVVGCEDVKRNGRPYALLRSTRDHDKVREVLGRVEPSHARLDPTAALAEVASVAEADGLPRKLVVLSDFQRGDWEPRDEPSEDAPAGPPGVAGGGAGGIGGQVRRLRDSLFTIRFRPVAGTSSENCAILSVGPAAGRPPAEDVPCTFEVEAGNFGTTGASVDVTLSVDGKALGTKRVSLRGRSPAARLPETARVEFPWSGRAGSHFAEAAISHDRLKVDDRRGHAFTVRQRIRVLAVDGDPHPGPGKFPETEWLRTALSLRRGVTPVDLRAVDRGGFAREGLEDVDVVVVANLDLFPEGTADRLASFVRRGGGLLLFVGDRVSPSDWNAALARPGPAGLLPARLADRATVLDPDAGAVLDLSPSKHPALHDLTDPAHGTSFEPPRTWGWWPVLTPLEPGAEVLLRLKDLGRTPLLLERRAGRGRVLLCATTADTDWGGPATDLLYAPFLNELVAYLASEGPGRRDLVVHQPVLRTVPSGAREISVSGPDGQLYRDLDAVMREDPDDPGRQARTVLFTTTGKSGRYTLRWKAPRARDAAGAPLEDSVEDYAVDVDPREGDTARSTIEGLRARYPEIGIIPPGSKEAVGGARMRPAAEGDLSPMFLAAGVLMLVLEMFLAAAFGRRRG